jgi:4a-hydroxytetrahydrobiopterin dehydratase
MKRLSEQDLNAALTALEGWSLEQGKLHRQFVFPDFGHAMGFMVTAAPGIEKKDHHPEWSNVYNKVTVDLVTHSAGGVTQMDVDLAKTLNSIAHKLS